MHDRTSEGLTEAEAARILAEEGPNALPAAKRRGLVRLVLGVLREPMFLLLISCGGLYLLLGDLQEALMLLGFVFGIIGITAVQERRTERALEALADLSEPRALVIRGGVRRELPAAEVVRGDRVVVAEGQRIPADGVLREGTSLSVDESLLTGESLAVSKSVGGEDGLFAGSLVVRGSGVAEVTATGTRTEMGRIGVALAAVEPGRSGLQDETARIVRVVAVGAGVVSVGVTLIYGLTRGEWIEGLLSGLATAMALLPEEFPVVLTVFLALGAWRISRVGVLTRRMSAIETLGTTTVLCTDKTGTLTENRMVVRALWAPTAAWERSAEPADLEEGLHRVVEHALLASPTDPNDPMEQALHVLGGAALKDTEHLHPDWALHREYPLSPELLAMTRAWHTAEGVSVRQVSAKGSPEAIFDLCHLDPSTIGIYAAEVDRLAARGWRVLGVAHAQVPEGELPEIQHDFAFAFDGLVAFEDPLREGIPEAIALCAAAGVRVLMITGDYPATAATIARDAGLPQAPVLAGPELRTLDDAGLQARLHGASVAARIAPEDKLRIVQALQADGEIVAMTGDGVNDAPALAAAHIGVAMGRRGTEVAREAAALVLVDDDFDSLVGAMAQGRRIFENLRKSMAYIVAIHVPIAGLAVVPILLGWPPALLPVHIVLMELVIDPACSLVFEAEPAEAESMRRPPRPKGARLIDRAVLFRSVTEGLLVLGACMAVLAWSGERSLMFVALMVGNLGLILSNRSWSHSALQVLRVPNPVLGWVIGGALALALGVVYLPGIHTALHFVPPALPHLAVAIGAGLATLAASELLKWATPERSGA